MIEMVIEQEEILEKVNKILRKDFKNRSLLETIEALVVHIEKVDKEFIAMSQSIAEDDVIIQQLQEEVEKGKHASIENCRLRRELMQPEDRIKELEKHELTFKKPCYADIDD
jgi:predicted RNase H-like nuclease (RuvC/YqgF family)